MSSTSADWRPACLECGSLPELLDEDLTCGPCRLKLYLKGQPVSPWTVIALHDECRDELLIAGVMAGHHGDESTAAYTAPNLYRFLSFVEALTADEAEELVLKEFWIALEEMAAEMAEA